MNGPYSNPTSLRVAHRHSRTRQVTGCTDNVVIIGAGLGGLATAVRLAGAGRSVTILEQAEIPGGRAGQLRLGGYRFDTGPTVLTMPDIIADTLASVGERLEDRLDLIRLTPAYRANFDDGTHIDVHADPDRMEQQIAEHISGRDAAGYRDLVKFLRTLYKLEMKTFIDRNLDSPMQLLGIPALRLAVLGGLRRLPKKIGTFLEDDRLRRIFSFQAMYAGLAPQDALAIFAVIAYMDTVAGVFYPRGGMHALPQALADAACAHGVRIRYQTRAERIEIHADRATAVHTTDGERIPADVVVVNADLPIAYDNLMPDRVTPHRVQRLRYSPSCVLLHLGARAHYPDLEHHNIYFGATWDRTFREITTEGAVMSDPSFLLSNPTRTDGSLAPPDRQAYYILFPAPNTRAGLYWPGLADPYRRHMLETLHERGLTNLGESTEVTTMITPADWEAQGIAAGAPFAAAHTFRQSGPFRSPTLDRRVDNLVWVGSNTQPGVGVPMVLLSGKLAAARITGSIQ